MTENKPIELNKTGNLLDDILADPFGDQQEIARSANPQVQNGKPVKLVDALPEENRAKAYQLAAQIDPTNHQAMILYGTQAQGKLLSFSQTMLEHVQKKDIGEVGEIINDLMKQLNEVNPDELKDGKPSLFARMFGKISG